MIRAARNNAVATSLMESGLGEMMAESAGGGTRGRRSRRAARRLAERPSTEIPDWFARPRKALVKAAPPDGSSNAEGQAS
eukprot:SAG31_NODE_37792_length_301_cov_1.024752_1_plen_80_part_00